MEKVIDSFRGEYSFLSNFYPSPITFSGKTWPTVEHVFQAGKTMDSGDREKMRLLRTPAEAKRFGRRVSLRPDWNEVKMGVMLKSLRLKFKQNAELKKRLLATGEATIIEGNMWHDNTWGDCRCGKCKSFMGQNFLGKMLMQVRGELGG